MSRFDYVLYDEIAVRAQTDLKNRFEQLEATVASILRPGRAQSLVMTKIEEAYMWCGKAVRDDQIARNGSAELQEGRGNE